MCFLFIISILGLFGMTVLHFLSVEHLRLEERYGEGRGSKIGETLGIISGWGLFLFWAGVWFSPQPRFVISIFQDVAMHIPVVDFSVPVSHLIVFMPFILLGARFGIGGVKDMTLKVAEAHRTERIIVTGVYSIVRHPQYLGGLLSHIGISFLLSAWYSLLSTSLMAILVYLISKKEERELIKEFGREYEDYKKKVPMLMPKWADLARVSVPNDKEIIIQSQ